MTCLAKWGIRGAHVGPGGKGRKRVEVRREREQLRGVPSGDVIIYTRHYMSARSRGNIVQDIPRIHYARKRGGGGRGEREGGGRRSMAGF